MGTSQQPLVALDTNFIISLGDSQDICLDCISVLKKRNAQLVVTPTVAQEIIHKIKNKKDDPEVAESATKGFKMLHPLGCKLIPSLDSTQQVSVAQISSDLRHHGLIDYSEINDSMIIAESAALSCDILMSFDGHMTEIDQPAMRQILGLAPENRT